MLKIGYTLNDVGDRLTWLDVADIIEHSPQDSALTRVLLDDDDMYAWINNRGLQSVLADLIDTLQMFMYVYVSANSKHKPKQPKPYKRPWQQDNSSTRKFGKKAVSIDEFNNFWSSD